MAVKPFGVSTGADAQLIQPQSTPKFSRKAIEKPAMETAKVLSAANCGIVFRVPTWPAMAAADPAPPGSESHPDPHPQAAAAAAARSSCLSVVQFVSARKWQMKLKSMCTCLHASSVRIQGCATATGAECVLHEASRCLRDSTSRLGRCHTCQRQGVAGKHEAALLCSCQRLG